MVVGSVIIDGPPVTDPGSSRASAPDLVTLDVWREVCRHIEIVDSVREISAILSKRIPMGQVLIRRIDVSRCCIETVALGVPVPDYLLPDVKTECVPHQMEELLLWAKEGRLTRRGDEGPAEALFDLMVPAGISGDTLVGPLDAPLGSCGILIVVAPSHQSFDSCHAALITTVLEPLAVALENDRRLREMAVMQTAAEADKDLLLTKLGRKDSGDKIIGADSGLRGVMERVSLVAKSDVPVLILGETGTGKEVIAKLIHTQASNHGGPFLRINCGAIPPELIDSQLFGHEKGAFTGAVDTHQGWFERADGGTLLLDEIGELPLAAQVRLLRILQDRWLERVGGRQPIHVNVRIVAATHRDLATMVREGKFREDLWYRLAVFPILLPPLRERQEDIAALARHFAERAAARFVLPLALPSAEDLQLLLTYPWPGNIRELSTVIDRAAILGNGRRLEIAHALGGAAPQSAGLKKSALPGQVTDLVPSRILSLDAAMKQHIEMALSSTCGRIEGRRGAAFLLKINPHTLRARMRKLGIDWSQFRELD